MHLLRCVRRSHPLRRLPHRPSLLDRRWEVSTGSPHRAFHSVLGPPDETRLGSAIRVSDTTGDETRSSVLLGDGPAFVSGFDPAN